MDKSTTITAQFRSFVMPCCGHHLDWLGSRLPGYCPECGASVFIQLREDSKHTITDTQAELFLTKD
jgi:hypothetical protein